jgi:hypothetical protein
MNLIRKVKLKVCSNKERVKMLRDMGVTIGEGCEIYANVSFDS